MKFYGGGWSWGMTGGGSKRSEVPAGCAWGVTVDSYGDRVRFYWRKARSKEKEEG